MLNENTIRKKVLLRLLGSPLVLAPGVMGVTACTVAWALNFEPALGWFAALAGVLGSMGAYLTRLVWDDGKTARAVLADLERAEQASCQAALDDLDERLVHADKDPRPELALRDMRALLRAFEEIAQQGDSTHLAAIFEVHSRVRQLFEHSVRSLEQTLKLGDTAQQLQLPAARRPLLDQRERIIADIEAGVKQLGSTLAALQQLSSAGEAKTELARMREELDGSLDLARRVEVRLQSLFDQTSTETREQPARIEAEKQKGH